MSDPRKAADALAQRIYKQQQQQGKPVTASQARDLANKSAQRVERKKGQ